MCACLAALEWERGYATRSRHGRGCKIRKLRANPRIEPRGKKPAGSAPLPQLEILEDLRERAKDIDTDDMDEELDEPRAGSRRSTSEREG